MTKTGRTAMAKARVDPDVWEAFKRKAAEGSTTATKLLIDYMADYIKEPKRLSRLQRHIPMKDLTSELARGIYEAIPAGKSEEEISDLLKIVVAKAMKLRKIVSTKGEADDFARVGNEMYEAELRGLLSKTKSKITMINDRYSDLIELKEAPESLLNFLYTLELARDALELEILAKD